MKTTLAQEISVNEQRVIDFNTKLQSQSSRLITHLKNLDSTLALLNNAPDYDKKNFPIITQFRRRLKFLISNFETAIKTAQLLQLPTPPTSEQENALTIYGRYEQLTIEIKNILNSLLRDMRVARTIVSQAKNANQDWVKNWEKQFVSWGNILKFSWELHLTEIRTAGSLILNSIKTAYPAMYSYKTRKKAPDLKRWNETGTKIDSFKRIYGDNYTFPQILYHFTKDWDMFERFEFKKWYRWTRMNKQANSLDRRLQKTAQRKEDFLAQDRLQQFQGKKKKLMNRVNLVRKVLQEMIHNHLIQQQDADKIYKIISMLELESMRLQTPKIASARVRRASKQLEKIGFVEGASILSTAAQEILESHLVKTAAGADPKKAIEVLRKIKQEMDSLTYGKHLDLLYQVMKDLQEMGRQNDVEAVEKIIRDELGSLEKLNKKLLEVYTSLSKVPLELSALQDMQESSLVEEAKPVELEVKEEEIPSSEMEESIEVSEEEVESSSKPSSLSERIRQRREELKRQREEEKPTTPVLEKTTPNI